MNVRMTRFARLSALVLGSAGVILMLWALLPNTTRPYHGIDWDAQLVEIAGRPVDRLQPESGRAVWVYPLALDGRLTGGVVVTGTTGYRGQILLATTVDRLGDIRASRVIAHVEGLSVRRDLRDGELDATTGATTTADAIARGRELAARAVLALVEDQP